MCCFALPAAATGDVAGAVQSTWTSAQAQIKAIVNNVVFPVIDVVLVILFFVKVSTSYFEYRKHGIPPQIFRISFSKKFNIRRLPSMLFFRISGGPLAFPNNLHCIG